VWRTFAKNSLVRDMTFRANFIIDAVTSLAWLLMNLAFYVLVFRFTPMIGVGTGWGQYEFFVFLATTLFVNSLMQAFFMPNAEELSELIRTGGLDFALLKPIDTQFLVSFARIEWSALGNFLFACGLAVYALWQLTHRAADPLELGLVQCLLFPVYVACGVAILYSLMISLAALSVWLGRNQNLYDFWFYITNFSRYPMEIYQGRLGTPLRTVFTFLVPVLIVVNVPARILARPLATQNWWLVLFAALATVGSLAASRWTFQRALATYRSASS
jgi:ABC-2 type transport system permease protein